MAFDIDRYFRVLRFLRDNPTIVSKCRQDGQVYKGKLNFCPDHGTVVDHIPLQQYITDKSLTNPNRADLMMKILDWDPIYSLSLPKDFTVANTALEARDKLRNYFGNVIVPGSYAYNTRDIDLFRQLVVDWSATAKTFKDLMRHASDAFTLDDDDIDKAIRGFGIDFVNKKTLPSLITRQFFLLALSDLYKIKGSSASIVDALYFAGLSNCFIREYWVERLPNSYKNLQIRGIAAGKWQQQLVNKRYEWKQDQSYFDDAILTWDNFERRLLDIGDPHWWYTKPEIVDIEWDSNTWIGLPSITPYFGVEYVPDMEKYNTVIGMIEKLLSAQFNAYLQGEEDLIPREIGVSGYNEDLTERDLWIDGYNEAITMLETFLAWVYSQIRYDEYVQYKNLVDFLDSKNIQVNENDYTYPWAYQELIYSLYKRIRDGELIDEVIPLAAIVKSYPRNPTNYYCSTNELVSWWINREVDSLDPLDPNPHTSLNVPSIFFDIDYPFLYQVDQVDTTMDRILYYNGPRNIDFHDVGFEYKETIEDQNRFVNQDTTRVEFDNVPKSYHESNRHNQYLSTEYDALYRYLNTYYEYAPWISENYTEDIEHDGSALTPYYVKKYPKPQQWNWAVDSNYFYYCKSPSIWVRTDIETDWSGTTILPTSTSDKALGYHLYDDGYVYIYASTNKWVRYACETSWNYCDGPITPEGYLRLKSDHARYHIKAKVSSSVATSWLGDQTAIAKTTFEFIIDPLGENPITHQYTITDLDNYIHTNRLVMDENGYLLVDFDRIYFNGYVFSRMYDQDENIVWVRTEVETDWSTNGSKIYQGGYRFPNLDLTNRYDAERILRGQFVLEVTDLDGLDGATNGGEILVSKGSSGYPEVWIYDEELSVWKKDTTNRVASIPGKPEIKQINLGFNNKLISWMDQSIKTEEEYGDLADKFLNSFSNYIKVSFNDMNLDIAAIFKNVRNTGLYKNLIDFFKPKRARLLYFSINVVFDDRLFNSVKVYEAPEASKIIQQINDYVPRQDLQFIQNNNGLYKKSYHQDDRVDVFEIPTNSEYGEAILYLKDFEDDRVNGYYFNRSDLGQDSSTYFLNDKNICLTLVKNGNVKIHGYSKQWIIAPRADNLDWCNSLYACYDTDYKTGTWYAHDETPSGTNSRKVFEVGDLTENDVRRQDIRTDVDFSSYSEDVENPWNNLYPRTEPAYVGTNGEVHVKTLREETSSFRHWGPVLCKDPYNLRTVFPSGALGHPENLEGSRVTGYDALNRSGDPSGNQEEPHSFLRWPYWDDDIISLNDGFTVRGHAQKVIERSVHGDTYYSSSDYNSYTGEKNLFGIGDGSKTLFKLNVLRMNSYNIKIYNGNTELIQNVDWQITTTEDETFIEFIGSTPSLNDELFYSYSAPIWWIFAVENFRSGPVYHRPVYMGISFTIYDCYPCRDLSTCCDYYDVGCSYDGPTNPQKSRYENIYIPLLYSGSENTLKKGPYLIYSGVVDEMIVMWQKTSTETSLLEWGTDDSYSVGSVTTSEYGVDHQHTYTITGLNPNTRYYYRVDGITGSFLSAPLSTADSFKFTVTSDNRTTPSNYDNNLKSAISTIETDHEYQSLLIYPGDWATGNTEAYWTNEVFSPTYSHIKKFQSLVPIMGCRGNHEGTSTIFAKYYPYPLCAPGTFYYSFEYANVKFVVMDDNITFSNPSTQYSWLENELATNTKQWLILILHKPAYSDNGGHGSNLTTRAIIEPLCITYGVDMVFSGHNHFYAHCVVNDIHWMTLGGSGPLYSITGTGTGLIYSKSQHSYSKVDVTSDRIYFEAIDSTDNSIMESFSLYSDGSWEHTTPESNTSEWTGGQYKDYNIVKLDYDEHTEHHRTLGYITNLNDIWNPLSDISDQYTVKEHWETEEEWNRQLDNPGDTYCTECDSPLFTPDVSFFEIPDYYKNCGIYHNEIYGTGFTPPYDGYNITWVPGSISVQTSWDFPYGYLDGFGNEMVHVYHKPSGYHYWEIRNSISTVVLRSELKEKRHDLDDVIDENIGNWQVEPDNFLNGNDVDPVEDKWSYDVDDPSTFLTEMNISEPYQQTITIGKDKSEITQNLIDGRFETSTWVNFELEDISGDPQENAIGSSGTLLYIPTPSTDYGTLYICVESDNETGSYLWKKAISSLTVEHSWSILSEQYIRPDSDNNYYGYYYRNSYLYLFVDSPDYSGWIRVPTNENVPLSGSLDKITNQWIFDDQYAYRFVSQISSFSNQSAPDYKVGNPSELYVCGDVVPYVETYEGIKRLYNKVRCECTLNDRLEATQIVYCPCNTYYQEYYGYSDSDCEFIKIRTVNPTKSSRKEHRFIPRAYESLLPTDFNTLEISSLDYYYLSKYIPFFLTDGLTGENAVWERDGETYYSRSYLDGYVEEPCDYYYYYYAVGGYWTVEDSEEFE